MQKKLFKLVFIILLVCISILFFRYVTNLNDFDWEGFELVSITSTSDSAIQKGYFYKTTSIEPKPLVVSLHSWRGHYASHDSIAILSKQKNINYIHPDFRGPNNTKDACFSELVQSDIDDAISFALKQSNVDRNRIYVIGASGGGYATLGTYMTSKYKIRAFAAWASITDLIAWYHESQPKENNYDKDVFVCTESINALNQTNAKARSPLYMEAPTDKRLDSRLLLYAGVHDGNDGSVPFTHSIHFYNKLLRDLKVTDSTQYVTQEEIKKLTETRKPLSNLGKVLDRDICLKKNYRNIQLVIFDGGHEMFHRYALEELLSN